MTFDNEYEITKIKEFYPDAKLVLRLLPDDSGSLMRFGSKFGASIDKVQDLLLSCAKHDLSVKGVSFHIGSGCFDTSKYHKAIALCKDAFNIADKIGIPPLELVDIGGGFSGHLDIGKPKNGIPSLEEFAVTINDACKTYFSNVPNVKFIAEPGRFFVSECSTLFSMVQGKRVDKDKVLYYVNDGVYGSMNCKIWDCHPLTPIHEKNYFNNHHDLKYTNGTFFGPTCDSMDVITTDHKIHELDMGDFVIFESMGAYTYAAGVEFNGCKKPHMKYIGY